MLFTTTVSSCVFSRTLESPQIFLQRSTFPKKCSCPNVDMSIAFCRQSFLGATISKISITKQTSQASLSFIESCQSKFANSKSEVLLLTKSPHDIFSYVFSLFLCNEVAKIMLSFELQPKQTNNDGEQLSHMEKERSFHQFTFFRQMSPSENLHAAGAFSFFHPN